MSEALSLTPSDEGEEEAAAASDLGEEEEEAAASEVKSRRPTSAVPMSVPMASMQRVPR